MSSAQQNDEEQSVRDPLLNSKLVQDGSVDIDGSPASASRTGGAYKITIAAILFVMVFAAMSIYGVSYNLVLFMVTKLGMSNAAAASQVSIWTGVHDLSPLLIAYVADAHLGKFKATLAAAVVYVAGMALLAVAAAMVEKHVVVTWLFFAALYMVALGKGFIVSLIAFGADQFDGADEVEARWKSSYFNWYYFSGSCGLLLAVLGVVYVGDRVGFSAAIFLCAACVLVGLAAFSSFARYYRYRPELTGNPYARIFSEYKASDLSGIVLVWLGSVVYEAMRSQTFSLFVEQADLMDKNVGGFNVPPASLNCFDPIAVLLWTVIYDRVLVPVMRRFTGNVRGFTFFQRMGTGLIVMTAAMVCAATLEGVRLSRVNVSSSSSKLSVLWQIPQFAFVGGSKVFYYVGLIEFLYDQVPDNLKTLGTAMSFFSASVGSFLSGFLVSITSSLTGETGWIPRDLNKGHLDYFFWLLVVLGVLNWFFFILCSYTYKRLN